MKPSVPKTLSAGSNAVRSFVAGWATCRFALQDLPTLRQRAELFKSIPYAPPALKHADGQTVVGLAAVARAIENHNLSQVDFSRWGVIAAPRFLGRAALAVALARFAKEGAWGVSPHLIPHLSLHALSGTVSQVLKIHGPNFGAGGGAEGAAEALLASAAMLADGEVPGVWLVVTGFEPDFVPTDPSDENATPPTADCIAVALALVPAGSQRNGWILSIGGRDEEACGSPDQRVFSLEDFAATLLSGAYGAEWRLSCGGWASWERANAMVEAIS